MAITRNQRRRKLAAKNIKSAANPRILHKEYGDDPEEIKHTIDEGKDFDYWYRSTEEKSDDEQEETSAQKYSGQYGSNDSLIKFDNSLSLSETNEKIDNSSSKSSCGHFPIELWLNILPHLCIQDVLKVMRLNKTWLNLIAPSIYEDMHAIIGFDKRNYGDTYQAFSVKYAEFGEFGLFRENYVTDFHDILSIFENVLSNPNSIMRPFYKNFKIDVVLMSDYPYYADHLKNLETKVNKMSQGDDRVKHINLPEDIFLNTKLLRFFTNMQSDNDHLDRNSRGDSFTLPPENTFALDDESDDDLFFNQSVRGDVSSTYLIDSTFLIFSRLGLFERIVINFNRKLRPNVFDLVSVPHPTPFMASDSGDCRPLMSNTEAYIQVVGLGEDFMTSFERAGRFEYISFKDTSKLEMDRFINLVMDSLPLTNCDEQHLSVMFGGFESADADRFGQPGFKISYPHIFTTEAGRYKDKLLPLWTVHED